LRVLKRGKCSLCLQVILYTIVVIKLFRKNEKLLKFSEKKRKKKLKNMAEFGTQWKLFLCK